MKRLFEVHKRFRYVEIQGKESSEYTNVEHTKQGDRRQDHYSWRNARQRRNSKRLRLERCMWSMGHFV